MKKNFLCVSCHAIGKPKNATPGSIFIEIILWCCFLVPGFIYSIWRVSSRKTVCKYCSSSEIIPENSPRAREILTGKNKYGK